MRAGDYVRICGNVFRGVSVRPVARRSVSYDAIFLTHPNVTLIPA